MRSADKPPTRIITPDGQLREGALDEDRQAWLWGRCVHHAAPGLVEVVAARRQPDGRLRPRSRERPDRFPAAGDLTALTALAARHRDAGEEVFCTPLTRRRRQSGKAGGVLPARAAWVDFDDPEALSALRAFAQRPHMVIYSGSGGAHAYWRLARPVSPEEIEAVNRKLAHHLGGDLGVCDRARIMRLPGTHNYKAGRPCRLVFCDLARPAIAAGRLTAGLTDPSPPPPPASPAQLRRHQARRHADDAAQIAPPAYFEVLARAQMPERGGHIPCPLPDHQEQLASCMVYPDPGEGWWCYGCQRGGTIYDLASLLEGGQWGRGLRGEEFRAAKERAEQALGIQAAPRPQAPRRRAAANRPTRRPRTGPQGGKTP